MISNNYKKSCDDVNASPERSGSSPHTKARLTGRAFFFVRCRIRALHPNPSVVRSRAAPTRSLRDHGGGGPIRFAFFKRLSRSWRMASQQRLQRRPCGTEAVKEHLFQLHTTPIVLNRQRHRIREAAPDCHLYAMVHWLGARLRQGNLARRDVSRYDAGVPVPRGRSPRFPGGSPAAPIPARGP